MAGTLAQITPLPPDPIVRRFVRAGRLEVIPARLGKRRRVLDWLAQQFEPGQVYPESTVNVVLARFHPDFGRCVAIWWTRGSWSGAAAFIGVPAGLSMCPQEAPTAPSSRHVQ